MASARQIAANRANAAKAEGPRTAAGKVNASRNAYRHGLSVPLRRDPDVCSMIELLAAELVGGDSSDHRIANARKVVEGQLEIERVREARCSHLAALTSNPMTAAALKDLSALDRYEVRARGMRDRAAAKLQP